MPNDTATLSIAWSPELGLTFSAALEQAIPRAKPNTRGPMLAKRFVEWRGAVLAQPKIDGMRLLISASGAKTRAGNRAPGADYLVDVLAPVLNQHPGIEIDGEWFEPGLTPAHLEAIAFDHSTAAKPTFNVFDFVSDAPAIERLPRLAQLMSGIGPEATMVETRECASRADLDDCYRRWIGAGYEGQMIRAPERPYIRGRSNALLKRKPAYDAADLSLTDA